jgi:hypothetical protein|tara:strand:- start:2114 stop:2407 length:294 start_codon:yes stop_codon:yes gene_type:complete
MVDKVEIGRHIREYNSGPAEALSCQKFNLLHKGGPCTKVDGVGREDGKKWSIKNTAIHLKDRSQKTFFHIQMKGSGKGAGYHGVLCHIHEHLFKRED